MNHHSTHWLSSVEPQQPEPMAMKVKVGALSLSLRVSRPLELKIRPAGPTAASALQGAEHAPHATPREGGVHVDRALSLGAARTRRSSKKARHPAAPRCAVFRWILSLLPLISAVRAVPVLLGS